MAKFAGILLVIVLGFGQEPQHGAPESPEATLQANPKDSLAHFRTGEQQLREHEFQSAANEFSKALNSEPRLKWLDAWAHFNLGEIFDITGQRDRAVREYQIAARTGDESENLQALITERLHRAAAEDDIKQEDILARYVSAPKVIARVAPVYSREARIAGLEGSVALAATVKANGSVADLRVVTPLGLGLDEAAEEAASRWSFEPGTTKDGPAPMMTNIELNFLLPSKRSHWRLLGVAFETPTGASRPHFLSTKYPRRDGISPASADQARLIAAMGRQEFVRLSFDVDSAGRPVRFSIQKANPPWGKEAISFVSAWRFSPGNKNGVPVEVPCSIDLVWGDRQFEESSLQWYREAFELHAIRSSSH